MSYPKRPQPFYGPEDHIDGENIDEEIIFYENKIELWDIEFYKMPWYKRLWHVLFSDII